MSSFFIPKNSTLQMIVGGILGYICYEEEICFNCKKPPGSEGCGKNKEKVQVETENCPLNKIGKIKTDLRERVMFKECICVLLICVKC